MKSESTLWRWGKEALLFVLILFVLSTLLNFWRAPKIDETRLPKLSGQTLEGQNIDTLRKEGRPFLLHFWGTWCPVCRQEAGNIEAVARRYPVLTVAVNSGSPEEIRTWMRERRISYPVLNDPYGTLAKRFRITTYPTSLIYDAEGRLKFVETGYTTTAGLLARMKLAE